MSCFMVRKETLSALAGWIESVLNAGFNYHGMTAPESLREALREAGCLDSVGLFDGEKIFRALYDLNAAAYIGRYAKNHPEVMEECYPFSPVECGIKIDYRCAEWSNSGVRERPWYGRMLKRLDCLVYQCQEEANRENKLLAALEELQTVFAGFVARTTVYYRCTEWG